MNITEMTRYLEQWDHATRHKRADMLSKFVEEHDGATGSDIEMEFANAASLFLTRLAAWLRLTYMTGKHLQLQLESILVFLASSCGQDFLGEFIEVGGILTLLEILGLSQATEDDRAAALRLLACVSNTGRKYKELICESFGVRAVAECLAKSDSIACQEEAKNMLQELSSGNPKYEMQVYKALIALLKSSSPEAQQISAQLLVVLQPRVGLLSLPTVSIVEPVLLLLRSCHVEVQYEASRLLDVLISYDIQTDILTGLVALLTPSKADMLAEKPDILSDEKSPQMSAPVPVFLQQAGAAKIIGMLSKKYPEVAESCVQLGCIHSLLVTMANNKYGDSQKQAALTLEFFVRSFPIVQEAVREALGDTYFDEYMSDPETFHLNNTEIHLDVLSSNKVHFPSAVSA